MQGNAHIRHKPSLRLIRQGFPDRPAYGTGVSEAILTRVAAGELPATVRLHRPGARARLLQAGPRRPRLRGGRRGRPAGGVRAGREARRRAGRRVHEGTLALAWATPAERPVAGTRDRFELLADDRRRGPAVARRRRPGRRDPGRVLPGRLERQRRRADEARRDRPAPDLGRRAQRCRARGHRLGGRARGARAGLRRPRPRLGPEHRGQRRGRGATDHARRRRGCARWPSSPAATSSSRRSSTTRRSSSRAELEADHRPLRRPRPG